MSVSPSYTSFISADNNDVGKSGFIAWAAALETLLGPVYQSGGNIGIGIATPNYAVQLHSAASHAILQLTNATTGSGAGDGSYIGVLSGSSVLRIMNQENAAIEHYTNGVLRQVLDASGNSGFGAATAPQYKIHAGQTSSLTTDPNNVISGEHAITHASGTRTAGVGVYGGITQSGAGTSTTLVGTYGAAAQSAGVTTRLEGVAGNASVSGGTCANLQAVPAIVQISGGTVTEAAVFRSEGVAVSAGTVGNIYGMLLDPVSITGGTVSNAYGIYMNMPTGATNNKGFYLTGTATNVWGHVNAPNGYNCGLIFEQNGAVNAYVYKPDGAAKLLFANSGVANALAIDLANQRVAIGGSASPVNTLDVTGSIGFGAPVTKTADFSLAATENSIINNKPSANCTMTLPAASSWTGRRVRIKNLQAFTVISATSNVVPLAGGAAGTAILAATAGKWAELESDGTNWVILAAA